MKIGSFSSSFGITLIWHSVLVCKRSGLTVFVAIKWVIGTLSFVCGSIFVHQMNALSFLQNYDTTESKLRREFEVYGPIKRVRVSLRPWK